MNALLRRFRPAGVPTFVAASRSHVGRVRSVNEDRVLDRSDQGLWAVADGMGGHSAGDVAAEIAVGALGELSGALTPDSVIEALAAANARILGHSGAGGSGTTMVALHLERAVGTLFWAGDSRAYRIRGGAVAQLTRDHSVVQEMVDAGVLAPGQAARHPDANVITRALGIAPVVDIETAPLTVARGDRFLLCSDGLSRSLDDRDFRAELSVDAQADRLLTNALQRDGSDNVSLVLVEVR